MPLPTSALLLRGRSQRLRLLLRIFAGLAIAFLHLIKAENAFRFGSRYIQAPPGRQQATIITAGRATTTPLLVQPKDAAAEADRLRARLWR